MAQAACSLGPSITGNTSKSSPEPPRPANPIHATIADRFHLPADLLIRSHQTFAKHRPNPNSMLEDSKVLYDRHAAETVRPTRIVLEATGGYERAVVAALAGLPVVNPRQTRDFARAHGILPHARSFRDAPRSW